MSARRLIISALSENRLGGIATLHDVTTAGQLVDAHRREVLAADGQAYDGELAMLRSLVRTLRTVVRENDTLAEVRRLLWEHASDETAAHKETRENGRSKADATPDTSREARLAQLLDTIRTRPGKWTTGLVQGVRRTTGGPVQRGTARRDLDELHRRGHLAKHGAGDGRYYTLRRKDSRS
ncbi:hypothetical protein [Streptomyces sp. NPDC047042]|uniref:hypothetical protein n=1 Tax=Streptomyces sp. NPDC047042 TaxID=3154807 RepID=UPI0033F76863